MAERLWRAAGFEVIEFPADWSAEPKAAGFTRNQRMVDALIAMRAGGAQVRVATFLDLCSKCDQRTGQQQLMPRTPGHFSHGTVHAPLPRPGCRHRGRGRHSPAPAAVLTGARPGHDNSPAAGAAGLLILDAIRWPEVSPVRPERLRKRWTRESARCRVPRRRPS
jgi:hypothetical protein